MRRLHITQKSAADVMGMKPSVLNQYLNGWKYMLPWIKNRLVMAITLLNERTSESEKAEALEFLFPNLKADDDEVDVVEKLFPRRKVKKS